MHRSFLRESIDVLHMWIRAPVFALQLGRWIDAAVPGMPNRARLLRAAHAAGAKGSVIWLTQACPALDVPRGAWEVVFTAATVTYDCCDCNLRLWAQHGRQLVYHLRRYQCCPLFASGGGVIGQPVRSVVLDRWTCHTEVSCASTVCTADRQYTTVGCGTHSDTPASLLCDQ